jgi:HPt (histidine-containing phosphotransfer) domain-containing protein
MNAMDPAQHTSSQEAMTVRIESDFEPLLTKFMANRKKETVTMRDALAQQDFDTVRKVAHGMKGAGGSYGFDRITEMAAVIEQSAKVQAAAAIESELEQLMFYLEHVRIVFV